MPAGVTWGNYVKFFSAALLSMAAGAELVHGYYRPLSDIDDYIEREIADLPAHLQEKVRLKMSSTITDLSVIQKPVL